MVWSFQPSSRAKKKGDQVDEPYVIGRLTAIVVILFRAGSVKFAQSIGQATIDLIGKARWNAWLPEYLNAPAEDDDKEAVHGLLEEVVYALKGIDPAVSLALRKLSARYLLRR